MKRILPKSLLYRTMCIWIILQNISKYFLGLLFADWFKCRVLPYTFLHQMSFVFSTILLKFGQPVLTADKISVIHTPFDPVRCRLWCICQTCKTITFRCYEFYSFTVCVVSRQLFPRNVWFLVIKGITSFNGKLKKRYFP